MRFFLITSMLFLSFAVQGQSETEKWFIDKVKEANTRVQSISSAYDQVQELSFMDEPLKTKGNFHFQKPGSLRWEQTHPSSYYLIINPTGAVKFDGVKKQNIPLGSPIVSEFKKIIMGTMDGSLFEDGDYSCSYKIDNRKVVVTIEPQRAVLKKRVSKILMTFDASSFYLLQMVFLEAEGDKRTMNFKNHQVNNIGNSDILFSTK